MSYAVKNLNEGDRELIAFRIGDQEFCVNIMQGIDLAVQKSRGLAEFIDTITGEIPHGWAVDVATALSLVKLAEMQKALGGATRHGHSQPLSKAAGDFDFF